MMNFRRKETYIMAENKTIEASTINVKKRELTTN